MEKTAAGSATRSRRMSIPGVFNDPAANEEQALNSLRMYQTASRQTSYETWVYITCVAAVIFCAVTFSAMVFG